MKTPLLLLLLGLFVGCASTEPENPPPKPPINTIHLLVIQADADWDWYISMEQPSDADAVAIAQARDAYEETIPSGDEQRIRKAAEKYIALVNELMVPLLAKPNRK